MVTKPALAAVPMIDEQVLALQRFDDGIGVLVGTQSRGQLAREAIDDTGPSQELTLRGSRLSNICSVR